MREVLLLRPFCEFPNIQCPNLFRLEIKFERLGYFSTLFDETPIFWLGVVKTFLSTSKNAKLEPISAETLFRVKGLLDFSMARSTLLRFLDSALLASS